MASRCFDLTRSSHLLSLAALVWALPAAPLHAGTEPRGNGDVNCDGKIDLSDAVAILGWLFLGDTPPCPIDCRPYQMEIDELRKAVTSLEHSLEIVRAELDVTEADLEACRTELETLQPQDWIVVPVQAVFVSNDDGTLPCDITVGQVVQWVGEANRVYAPARIVFQFSPRGADVATLQNTLINGLIGVEQSDWAQRVAAGNAAAAAYPGKLVVFFRHGPGPGATGSGFSWTDYNFAGMPGFDVTTVCGHQNITLFAHEIGHYLGLSHSFRAEYPTLAAAASAFTGAGSDPEVFEGDGILDTPPDPFTRDQQCNGVLGLTLGGVPLAVARHDIMSYYDSPEKTLSPGQIAIVRQVALVRLGRDIRQVLEPPALQVIEGEVAANSTTANGGFGPQDMRPFHGKWSGDRQLWWGGAAAGILTSTLQVGQAGLYRLHGSFTLAPDFGIHAVSVNGVAAQTIDLYSTIVRLSGPQEIGVFWLRSGSNTIRFQSAGRHPGSSGFGLGLDYLLLQKLD
jgi:hypothetical protein